MDDIIVVTDWEELNVDDFYLRDEWLVDTLKKTKEEAVKLRWMAKDGEIYEAYEVTAKSYALYSQMDANKIFIDCDGDYLFHGESAVINRGHIAKWEMEE